MADNTEKNIEDVQVGDYVLGKDGKAEVYELEDPVSQDYYIILLEDGVELRITDDHPIYARNAEKEDWSAIKSQKTRFKTSDLNKMSEVLTLSGWITIQEIKYVYEKVQTYNLKSVERNTFYADGILVHNKGPKPKEDDGDKPCCEDCGDTFEGCTLC